MKFRVSVALIALGLLILAVQGVQRLQAVRHGQLPPFEEDGQPVLRPAAGTEDKTLLFRAAPSFNPQLVLPTVGTLSLAGGIFLLVLTSGRRLRVR